MIYFFAQYILTNFDRWRWGILWRIVTFEVRWVPCSLMFSFVFPLEVLETIEIISEFRIAFQKGGALPQAVCAAIGTSTRQFERGVNLSQMEHFWIPLV